MKFNVLTLFPELFEQYLSQTILKRAAEKDIINFNIVNIRDYARNKHSQMDDIPFGGGAGMVLKPEAYWNFFYENYEFYNNENSKKPYVIFLSPQGKQLTHNKVTELSEKEEIVLISGRYEGLDQRVIDKFVDEEISIGDFVVSGGELPAMMLMDAVLRLLPNVLGDSASAEQDSFANGLLDCPHYTRPTEFQGMSVPEVLKSGNHALIAEWRLEQSLRRTLQRRPELLDGRCLLPQEARLLDKIRLEQEQQA